MWTTGCAAPARRDPDCAPVPRTERMRPAARRPGWLARGRVVARVGWSRGRGRRGVSDVTVGPVAAGTRVRRAVASARARCHRRARPRPRRRPRRAHRRPGRRAQRLGRRAGTRRRRGGGAAGAAAARGRALRATPSSPAPTSAGSAACCSPATSTPCRSPTTCPAAATATRLYGCGTSDMKAGDAVFLHVAASVAEPRHDLTLVFYDCEEIEAARNGLGRIERELPDWLTADLALLGEPTDGLVEAGCQGTLRVEVRVTGRRAHSARSWLGDNAVHRAAEVLEPARRLRRPARRDRRLRVPRGPAGRADHRRRRGQHRARRVRRHRQLPVRARPHRRRCRAARPRGVRRAAT